MFPCEKPRGIKSARTDWIRQLERWKSSQGDVKHAKVKYSTTQKTSLHIGSRERLCEVVLLRGPAWSVAVAQPALLMSAWMLRWRIILPIVLLQSVHLNVYYGGMHIKS
jgi:hypothetical protein